MSTVNTKKTQTKLMLHINQQKSKDKNASLATMNKAKRKDNGMASQRGQLN